MEFDINELNEDDIKELSEQYYKERDGIVYNFDGSFTDGFKEFVYNEVGEK